MARPPDPEFPQCPATEETHPKAKTTILIKDMVRLRPESGVLNWELMRAIERICERSGFVTEGGPDHHKIFVELSNPQMRAVVVGTISGFRLAKSPALTLDGPDDQPRKSFLRKMRTLLYLVARGNILFDSDGLPRFFKPTGPPPNHEMRERILARIRHDHPMHIAIAHDLIEKAASGPRTESEPLQ